MLRTKGCQTYKSNIYFFSLRNYGGMGGCGLLEILPRVGLILVKILPRAERGVKFAKIRPTRGKIENKPQNNINYFYSDMKQAVFKQIHLLRGKLEEFTTGKTVQRLRDVILELQFLTSPFFLQ